jgi:hypothetical protein
LIWQKQLNQKDNKMLHYKIIHEDGTEIFFTNKSGSGTPKEQLDRFLANNKNKTYSVFWKDMSTEYNWGWKPLHIAKGY